SCLLPVAPKRSAAGCREMFPSGPWVGFYNYRRRLNGRHRIDMQLTFANGILTGEGVDDVRRFVIRGRYNPNNRESYWTKSYIGAHNVFYRGFCEGKGIWGTWDIGPHWRGGFHIWPRNAGEGEEQTVAAKSEEPVDAIAREVVTQRAPNRQPFQYLPVTW